MANFSGRNLIAALCAALLLSACGGGASSGSDESDGGTQNSSRSGFPISDESGWRVGYISAPDGTQTQVKYKEKNGLAIHEGDIVLGTVEQMERTVSGAVDAFGNGASWNAAWPGGVVPYSIHESIPAWQADSIRAAIDHIERNTKVRFTHDLETHYQSGPGEEINSYIIFKDEGDENCWSWIGRQYQPQVIHLSDGCGTGTIVHEIGHALGLWHEHTRNDRDNYISIDWNNLVVSSNNYEKKGSDAFAIGAYDFYSIMHYSTGAGIIPVYSESQIESHMGAAQSEMASDYADYIGQRVRLSPWDIDSIDETIYADIPRGRPVARTNGTVYRDAYDGEYTFQPLSVTVDITAAGSFDPDGGSIQAYRWWPSSSSTPDRECGPYEYPCDTSDWPNMTGETARDATVTISIDQCGEKVEREFTLRVTDDEGTTATDVVTVVVEHDAPNWLCINP